MIHITPVLPRFGLFIMKIELQPYSLKFFHL